MIQTICAFSISVYLQQGPIACHAILCLFSEVMILYHRHVKLEAELAEMNWRVRWEDIMFGTMEQTNMKRQGSRVSLARVRIHYDIHTSIWREGGGDYREGCMVDQYRNISNAEFSPCFLSCLHI